jgi:toxin YoeB
MELFESEEAQTDKTRIKKSFFFFSQNRLKRMVEEMLETPYEGIGKPEALKYDLTGFWSRRLTDKERVVYYVENNAVYIVRYLSHYNDK